MKRRETQLHQWNIADAMTLIRMAASVLLLFLPLGSYWFFLAYIIAGVTDALDGWLARRTGKASEFGARLDSAADLLFYGVLLVRIFPVLWQLLPGEIWYVVTAAVLIRLASYTAAAVKYRRFAALHTWLNKLTGFGVFLLPFMLAVSEGVAYSWMVSALALASSAEELAIHLSRNKYAPNRKSLLAEERNCKSPN